MSIASHRDRARGAVVVVAGQAFSSGMTGWAHVRISGAVPARRVRPARRRGPQHRRDRRIGPGALTDRGFMNGTILTARRWLYSPSSASRTSMTVLTYRS